MSLHNYEMAFRDIALQFAAWASATDRRKARTLLRPEGSLHLWQEITENQFDEIFSLLACTESAFGKRWEKIDAAYRPLLLLRLQYCALISAGEAERAQRVLDLTGLGYRKALRFASEIALIPLPSPSKAALMAALGAT